MCRAFGNPRWIPVFPCHRNHDTPRRPPPKSVFLFRVSAPDSCRFAPAPECSKPLQSGRSAKDAHSSSGSIKHLADFLLFALLARGSKNTRYRAAAARERFVNSVCDGKIRTENATSDRFDDCWSESTQRHNLLKWRSALKMMETS